MQAITTPSGYVRWAGEVPATFSCPNTFPATDYWCFSVRNKGRLTSPLLGQCIVNVNWAPDGGACYSYAGYRSENHNPHKINWGGQLFGTGAENFLKPFFLKPSGADIFFQT